MHSEKKDPQEAAKKPYVAPQLTVYGPVGKITQLQASGPGRGGGIGKGPGPGKGKL